MSTQSTPHSHRCKECREQMGTECTDQSCAEGLRWVVVCIACYERTLSLLRTA